MTKHNKINQKLIGEIIFPFEEIFRLQIWRVMKLITLLLLLGLMQVSARGFSQKITIQKSQLTLEEVLLEINKQAGYSYSVSNIILQKVKPSSLFVKKESAEFVISTFLKNQPFSFSIINGIIIIREDNEDVPLGAYMYPPIDIRGRIVDENNQPMLAYIAEKGSRKSVSTDNNGFFLIKGVDPGGILIITGVNIESKEINVNGKSDLNIIKVKAKVITNTEVVKIAHTGYKAVKPNEEIGSVEVIGEEILREQMSTNIIERLKSNSSIQFNIGKKDAKGDPNLISSRGLSTINASPAPLIVLDNFIYTGSIDNIDPNDVESITLLKDAAATSIWGVGGGNGVIVITTKKGQFNQKLKVTVNSTLTLKEKMDTYYLPRISSSDYIDIERVLFDNGYFENSIGLKYPNLTPAVEIYLKQRNGIISSIEAANRIEALRKIDVRSDFNKYFNQIGIIRQNSINLSGGANNIGWTISGSFNTSVSNLAGTNSRANLRFSNIYKISKDISVTIGSYFSNNRTVSGKPDLESLSNRKAPYIQLADEYGNPLSVSKNYNSTYTDTVGGGKLLSWKYFPLDDYKHDVRKNNIEQFGADLGLNIKLFKKLQLGLYYNYQRQSFTSKRTADLESFYTRDLINQFTNLNETNPLLRNPVPKGGIIQQSTTISNSQNLRAQVDYTTKWGMNEFSIIGGNELREAKEAGGRSVTSYGFQEIPFLTKAVNYNIEYRQYVTGNMFKIPGTPYLAPPVTNRYINFYGNASYVFDERYSASGSFRKDASNIFGLKTNDKWNPLWSTGIGWEISNERFYRLKKIIPFLKLRLTYGYSGNLDKNKTATPVIIYGTNADLGVLNARILYPGNPKLKWEKLRQINIALSFSLKEEKITGNFEFYQKNGTDLYGLTPYNYTSFVIESNSITDNVASMKGKGAEVTLNIKVYELKNFQWTTNLFYNYNTSFTTKYLSKEAKNGNYLIGTDGNTMTPVVGKPLYAIAGYKFLGLDASGNPQGILDGHLTTAYSKILSPSSIYSEQLHYVGPANATHFGSLVNRFSYKGFTAAINIAYKLGYYFKKTSFLESDFINSGIGHKDFEKRWKKSGDELVTNVPAFFYPVPQGLDIMNRDLFYSQSDALILKADNIRLQYINLNYNLRIRNRNARLQQINIYANIADIGIIWTANKEHIDPDYPASIPPSRSYSIGVRANF